MTRINAKIKPIDLCDKHLLAEYREIVRVPNSINNKKYNKKNIDTFILGTGHVIFFYNKLKFLHDRFIDLRSEMIRRKFNANMTDEMFYNLPTDLYNDWRPVLNEYTDANKLICDRICERVNNMSKVYMCGKVIDKNEYINYLKNIYN